MFRLLTAATCLVLFSSCIFHKKGADHKDAKPKQARLVHGMTHQEVLDAVTDRSEVMVAEFNKPQGHLVTYVYTRYGKAGLKAPKYYLYFLNDTLIRKSTPEPLRKGAREALREHREWLLDQAEEKERREAEAERRAKMQEERAQRKTEAPEHKEKKGLFGRKKHKSDSSEEQQ